MFINAGNHGKALPKWANDIIEKLLSLKILPIEVKTLRVVQFNTEVTFREPPFDQLIINSYKPGEVAFRFVEIIYYL